MEAWLLGRVSVCTGEVKNTEKVRRCHFGACGGGGALVSVSRVGGVALLTVSIRKLNIIPKTGVWLLGISGRFHIRLV